MKAIADVQIGARPVGHGHPVYIVAEIGINHNGDLALARKSIDAAQAAGVDAVKFQNYKTDDFVPTLTETHSYVSQGQPITETQHDMFKRYELSDEQVGEIASYCQRSEIDFHSTPTNEDGISLLQKLGVGVLKNGSDYLSHLPLIECMGRTGLPTVLSTGMATVEDVEEAVTAYRAAGGNQLILLHCVSQYPAPADELNLRKISELQRKFSCPIGFSDHSEGMDAAVLAVALGAIWIEKHFTLDKGLPGPDHAFSIDPDEMAQLVARVRSAERALGKSCLSHMSARETESRTAFRLSCAAAMDLTAGQVLNVDNIAYYRPGTGYPPAARDRLIGRRISRDVLRGEILTDDTFE